MVYVPEKGEKVRVLEVSPKDRCPTHKVGDVVEVGSANVAAYPSEGGPWIRLYGVDDQEGTWCKVEAVSEDEPLAFLAEQMAAVHDQTLAVLVAEEQKQRETGFFSSAGERVPLEAVPPPPFMSTDSATRKLMPVATGFLKYFPDAVLLQAWVSRAGNEKHNPGQPLHWDKSKSADEPDAEVRHMLDHFRNVAPDPGLEPLAHLGHLASKAWRANAELQRACDEARAAYERGEEWRK